MIIMVTMVKISILTLCTAIQRAEENGHTEVVKLLLQDERVDPAADNNDGNKLEYPLSQMVQQYKGLQSMDIQRWSNFFFKMNE